MLACLYVNTRERCLFFTIPPLPSCSVFLSVPLHSRSRSPDTWVDPLRFLRRALSWRTPDQTERYALTRPRVCFSSGPCRVDIHHVKRHSCVPLVFTKFILNVRCVFSSSPKEEWLPKFFPPLPVAPPNPPCRSERPNTFLRVRQTCAPILSFPPRSRVSPNCPALHSLYKT